MGFNLEKDSDYQGGIGEGKYTCSGKENCDSGAIYDAPKVELELKSNGYLKGTVEFNHETGTEGTNTSVLHGNWDENGSVDYFLLYLGEWYHYEGTWRGLHIAGHFFTEPTYEDTPLNRRGGFLHTVSRFRE